MGNTNNKDMINTPKENNTSKNDKLGDYIKNLENKWESKISKDKPFIIRLDGYRFSKSIKSFNKPLTKIFTDCIINTAKDLLCEFLPTTVFVEYDKITLIFPSINNDKIGSTHIFNGKILKLCSSTAG
jgi:tRNA(His) 5'-end guanylyltransferase